MAAPRGPLAEAVFGRKRSLYIHGIVFDIFQVSVYVVVVTHGKNVEKHSERTKLHVD